MIPHEEEEQQQPEERKLRPPPAWLPTELRPIGPLEALLLQLDETDLIHGNGKLVCKRAAAIAIAWPSTRAYPVRPRPVAWRPGVDVLDYGRSVYDALVGAGLEPADVLAAGRVAHQHCSGFLAKQEEIDDATDFSEGQGSGSGS